MILDSLDESFQLKVSDIVEIRCTHCGELRSLRVSSVRVRAATKKPYICRSCSNRINAQKCRKETTIYHESIYECSDCKKKFTLKIKNYRANLRRNRGLFRCNSCSLSRAHIDGKFDKIYTKEFKQKLDSNSKSFWRKARDTWREKLVTPEFRRSMSEYGKRAWQVEGYRERMALVRLQQPRTSTQQEILYSLLSDLGVKFFDDRSVYCKIGYYTFDCRIDPQEGISLKKSLLIEVQGDYWHSLSKIIAKDKSKSTYIKTYFPEFDLKYLWEHEFNNRGRILDMLRYWLGLDTPGLREFDFTDVTSSLIEAREAEIFVSKYHYAGRIGRSGTNIGFFLGSDLVAVCVFACPVRQEVALKQGLAFREVLELSRFCIHPSYQVRNFASWLLARSIVYVRKQRSEIRLLVSFADSSYNHLGTIYKASNWHLDGEVAPDYWYADDRGYICHKKTLWNKAKQMCMTEAEYCTKFNYVKIWGDKKLRYIYKL